MKPPARPKGGIRKGMPISPDVRAAQMIKEGKRPGEIKSATSLGRKRVSMIRVRRPLG